MDLGLSDSEATVYLAMVSGARTARDLVIMLLVVWRSVA